METTAPAPVEPAHHRPRLIRFAVLAGIVVILNVLFFVIRALVLPAPQLADYCPAATAPTTANTAVSCDAQGGVWTENGPIVPAMKTVPATSAIAPTGYCDMYAKCQPVYDAATQKYDLSAFSLIIAFGLLALLAGTLLPFGSAVVSSGLAYGGVVAFIAGSVSYWNEAGDWVRLLISIIALAALLYIGWKKFKD